MRETKVRRSKAGPPGPWRHILLGGWSAAVLLGSGVSAQASPQAWHALVETSSESGSWEDGASATRSSVHAAYASAAEAANPYGFSTETRAEDCAAACHNKQLLEWGEAAGSDMPPAPIWDEADEAGQLDPYNSTEPGSMHKLAWKDYEFQLIFHEQNAASAINCYRCHIPAAALDASKVANVYAPPTRGVEAVNAAEGITCVSCHLTSGGEIAGPESYEDEGNGSGHAVQGLSAFSDGVTLCASCHDDTLFGALTATVSEYLASRPDASRTCVSCHMTNWQTGEVSHLFAGGHSLSVLQRALSVDLPRSLSSREPFSATLTNEGAWHNVPTGESFRAFQLVVRVRDNRGKVVLSNETSISTRVVTPTFYEIVDYDRIDPIGLGESRTVRMGNLDRGVYTVEAELNYFQIKAAVLKPLLSPKLEYVEAFGKKSVIAPWSYSLTVI